MKDRRVALVVLTHDRRNEVRRTLEHALASGEASDIVVVDDGSSDGTARSIAHLFPSVRVIRSRTPLGAAGRNLGVRATQRRYVAFSDDDTWWAPGALARAADALDAHPRLAIVTPRVLVGRENREDPSCTRMRESPLEAQGHPGSAVVGFMAGACVVRRRVFLAAGGYERRLFLGGEEALLALDVLARGGQIAYLDDLIVHRHPSPPHDGRKHRRRLLRNGVAVAWLRRPASRALDLTRAALADARRSGDLPQTLLDLARAAPWIALHRRLLPDSVEASLRQVEDATPSVRIDPHALPAIGREGLRAL